MSENIVYKSNDDPKWYKVFQMVCIIFFIWISVVYMMKGTSYDEDATVNVFPDSRNAKNYELTATVRRIDTAPSYVWLKTQYAIDRFEWPNGGWADFKDCFTDSLNTMVTCTSKQGDTYGIKISKWTSPDS